MVYYYLMVGFRDDLRRILIFKFKSKLEYIGHRHLSGLRIPNLNSDLSFLVSFIKGSNLILRLDKLPLLPMVDGVVQP